MRSGPISSPTFIVAAAADVLGDVRNQAWRRAGHRSSTWSTPTPRPHGGRRTAGLPEACTANRCVNEPATHITEIGLCREPVSAELAANVDSTPTA